MIHPPVEPRRGTISVARSSLAIEVLLNIYALGAMAVVARLVLRGADIPAGLAVGSLVYRWTDPLVAPMAGLPGADRPILGAITLPDLTLAALVALIPLAAVARTAGRR
ncbi:MAG: hypothetical protein H0U40_10090 [Chloroflexia bacterium]|nr:hypothetical protein [Chloroflexia bacterium]MDQ3513182.1 hypothetical protein [Chloroflexota bacterium]